MAYVSSAPTGTRRPSWDRLYETAAGQQGLFTTKQAADAGYSPQLLIHHLRTGKLARVQRGVYRLVHFPAGDREDLVAAWLWSEQMGVASHQTALELHQLSDVLPTRLHITLPLAWRRRRLRTSRVVMLHYGDVPPEDRGWFGPIPTTTVRRTLSDCARWPLSPELLQQAAEQALERGLVTRSELAEVDEALEPYGGLDEGAPRRSFASQRQLRYAGKAPMTKPTTIDQYLRALPADQRRALEKLRAQIKAVVPKAEEHIAYGLCGFKVDGRPLIYMGAAKNHCAIYGARADDALAEKLKGFKQSKGTIQFTPDKPIPAGVVKEIVKARLAALEERVSAKKKAPAKKKKAPVAKKKAASAGGTAAVEALLAELEHPQKAEVEAVRALILGADKRVREDVKWNAPSFYITEHFATFNLRARDGVQVVFHTGAKVKANAKAIQVDDSAGILKWPAKDRCIAKLKDMKDVRAKKAAFVRIVRQWIAALPEGG